MTVVHLPVLAFGYRPVVRYATRTFVRIDVLTFWLDPHHAFKVPSASHSMHAIEGLARALSPTRRRIAQPMARFGIIVPSGLRQGACGVPARWGLASRLVAPERRDAHARESLTVDLQQVWKSPMTRHLWLAEPEHARCLVPATGWLYRGGAGATAYRPKVQPAMFAGLCWDAKAGKDGCDYSFLLLVTENHRGGWRPVVIVPGGRDRWLFGDRRTAFEATKELARFDRRPLPNSVEELVPDDEIVTPERMHVSR